MYTYIRWPGDRYGCSVWGMCSRELTLPPSLCLSVSLSLSLSHTHTPVFTINFPCTRQKKGVVNFTLNFEFNSAAVDGLDALQGRGFNLTGANYCNCSILQCNQQSTPGPEGESLLGNQIFYIVMGSVVLIIIVIVVGLIVIVVMFCYYQSSRARVLSANTEYLHTDSELLNKDIHPI